MIRREMSFQINNSAQIGAENDAAGRGPHNPADAALKLRRLSDVVETAFLQALAEGEVAIAEELLTVMRGMDERYRIRGGNERRDGSSLARSARHLEAKKRAGTYRLFSPARPSHA